MEESSNNRTGITLKGVWRSIRACVGVTMATASGVHSTASRVLLGQFTGFDQHLFLDRKVRR